MEYHYVKSSELLKVYGIGVVVFKKEDRLVVFSGEKDYANHASFSLLSEL